MSCTRFQREVRVTRYAQERMAVRAIGEALLLEVLETGIVRAKDETRIWVAKAVPGRDDNLVCTAVSLEQAVIVKTVMHHFRWEE